MRDRYLEMRQSGDYNLNWFFEYYVSEFPNIPKNWINNQGQVRERELIQAPQFFQAFQMSFQLISKDILDHLDRKFGVTRIEDESGKIIHIS